MEGIAALHIPAHEDDRREREDERGVAAVDLAGRCHPDVVVMDIRMPGMDGIKATRAIMATEPRSRVLILTTFDLDEYAFGALRLGASVFILKDVLPSEFVRAVRSVADGDAVIAPSVTRRLLDVFAHQLPDPGRAARAAHSELDELTVRERDVLTELAGGFSNAEIAERLCLAEATVKTHLGRVLTKLGLRDRVHAVVYAYEAGLVDRRLGRFLSGGVEHAGNAGPPVGSVIAARDRGSGGRS